jgi:aspartate kinase
MRIAEAKRSVRDVAVVVSAMGDTTDDLLSLAEQLGGLGDKREIDQLLATGELVSCSLMAIALKSMGFDAVSLSGQQCGIQTDANHTRARIRSIDSARHTRELDAGRIPVVAGFQGVGETGDVTTLGRGGSDTTAVALAAAVKRAGDTGWRAQGAMKVDIECDIFTDVDGVYTADPRVVPEARLLPTISYDEMMEAASQGARVMHLRAVELGRNEGVPIRVLHSQRHGPGTLICQTTTPMETQRAVTTVALKTDIGRVTLANLPNRPGLQRAVFDPIAKAGISVDDIIQTEAHTATTDGDRCALVFTVDRTDLAEVQPLVERAVAEIGGTSTVDLGLSKVSAVGVGMQSQPGVAARMFSALADAGVRVANITTSEIKISCIIDERDGKAAVKTVHDAFGLAHAEVRGAASRAAAV